ncbi:MAG: excinuclease ABC subunit UvrC [Bacteroidota bacterium]|nr:excinuclease ABC subunit UvrC [Bacteroidota bacterium]
MTSRESTEALRKQINDLPSEPGIYKYFNEEGQILYVGKAKDLKKRVSSYFTKTQIDSKTKLLVNQINRVEFIVVNSESDALLLENNLIKTHQPKFNILLKDDKSYPYIILTKERFPKIYQTRKFHPEKGTYYGPFTSIGAMRSVLNLIKNVLPLRNCELNLTNSNITKGKFKKCLEYHLGNCKAPCEGLQTEEDYNNDIRQAKEILKGDLSIVKWYFKDQIKTFSKSLEFEKAQKAKEKLLELEKYQSNTLIANQKFNNIGVFTIFYHKNKYFVNHTLINHGRIIQSKTSEVLAKLNETESDILSFFIQNQLLEDSQLDEILTNIPVDASIKYNIPIKGDKKKLIDLSIKNIEYFIHKKSELNEKITFGEKVITQLQKDLNLEELPSHIECFDNSNIQGTTPVAAMVCFINGVSAKKEYRHFNIKTVVGPNDFDSMYEIVFRRYSRLIDEKKNLPKLIIIDGGKGQLSAAIKALEKLNLYGKIPIISIAKRLEEIYFPDDEYPILLKKNSESLKLLQRIRNEAHRFGITFHRNKRDKIKKGA